MQETMTSGRQEPRVSIGDVSFVIVVLIRVTWIICCVDGLNLGTSLRVTAMRWTVL